jgi:undecaprenyl-diphosphatase
MDPITASIASMNYPMVTELAKLVDSTLGFLLVTALLLLFLEPRWDKRLKVVAVLVVAFAISFVLKDVAQVERPCVAFVAKVACPTDYSFPSTHAAIAFALMLAFINKPTYPIYFIFAIFIAFSRVYLGVHTLEDVFAGLVIAPVAYQTVEILWKKKK